MHFRAGWTSVLSGILMGWAGSASGAPYPLPPVEWDRTLNGSSFAITRLSDGGVAAAGYVITNGVDFYLGRVGPDGTIGWERSFGGTGYDDANAVQPVADGGFIMVGRSESEASGTKSASRYGNSDYWVVRVDSQGNQLWDATFGGSSSDLPETVVVMADGSYLVGGQSFSSASGNKTAPKHGLLDAWLVRISANGDRIWDSSFGGASDERAHGVVGTQSGDYVFAGYSNSGISGNKTAPSLGSSDVWVVCIDANGEKKWDRAFGGSGSDSADDIQSTPDGGFIVVGSSNSEISGNKTAARLGYVDAWVVRLDAAGNKLWDRSYGTAIEYDYERFYSVAITDDGGFIFSGVRHNDMWLVRTDSSGSILWERTLPFPGLDLAYGVVAMSGNKCVVGGILNIDGDEATRMVKLTTDSPVLGSPRFVGSDLTFTLNGTSNGYAIEFSTNLSVWSMLATSHIATTAQETNIIDRSVNGRRFYRARLIE